jgi:hypothetical protein
MKGSDAHRTLHRTAMTLADKERLIKKGERKIGKLLRRFEDQSFAIDTELMRKTSEPVAVVELERGRGWMIPGMGASVTLGSSIVLKSRAAEFRVFFSGFDMRGRLRCELYVNGRHVRNRCLKVDESLKCNHDPDRPFHMTRHGAPDADCATISVWQDFPKRKIVRD